MLAGNYNVDYEKIYENIIENVQNQEVKLKNISNSNLSYTMIEFYTLIAMACLYGGVLGMTSINQNLARPLLIISCLIVFATLFFIGNFSHFCYIFGKSATKVI